jgi:hypothetical protein
MNDIEKIKRLALDQKGRPKNLEEVKVINVFEDRYRINVWVRSEEDGLQKNKIGASYFARFDGENLYIRDEHREEENR